MQYLKADTQTIVIVGPFVDATDGYTPETGVTLGAADAAEVLKHNSNTVVDASGYTFSAITGADGMYALTLPASVLDTEGRLDVYVADTSVCRPVKHEFMVVSANVFDSLFAAATTDYLQVDSLQIDGNATSAMLSGTTGLNADVTKISGSATAADNLEASALGIDNSTVASGSSLTSVVTNLTEATNDHYNGRTIVFTSGDLAGQAATITDYNGASKTITVAALTDIPASGVTFVIV